MPPQVSCPRRVLHHRAPRIPAPTCDSWHGKHMFEAGLELHRPHHYQYRLVSFTRGIRRILPKEVDNLRWWKAWGAARSWRRFRSSFSGNYWRPTIQDPARDIWEEEDVRARERLERTKREVDRDPYAALFGRRPEPFISRDVHQSWSDLYKAFLGLGLDKHTGENEGGKTTDTTARVKADKRQSGGESTGKPAKEPSIPTETTTLRSRECPEPEPTLEFDPISGRMAPRPRAVNKASLNVSTPPGPSGQTYEKSEHANSGSESTSTVLTEALESRQPKGRRRPMRSSRRKKFSDMTHSSPENKNSQVLEVSQAESDEKLHPQPVSESSRYQPSVLPEQTTKAEEADKELPADSSTLDVDEASEIPSSQSKETASLLRSEELWKKMENDVELLTPRVEQAAHEPKTAEPDSAAQARALRQALENELQAYADPASSIDCQETQGGRADAPGKLHTGLADTAKDDLKMAEQAQKVATEPSTLSALDQRPDPAPVRSAYPEIYRVIAYDPSTLQVATAETSSSQAASEILHPTEVLSRLNNPAKFLPYFAIMQKDGYEITSGGGDVLVFKSTRMTQTPAETSFASGSYGTEHAPENEQLKNSHFVNQPQQPWKVGKRYETTYTGNSSSWMSYPPPARSLSASGDGIAPPKRKPTARRVTRRMLLASGAAAATYYAVGVVGEYFHAGGEGGHRVDGFTQFESERRRNE